MAQLIDVTEEVWSRIASFFLATDEKIKARGMYVYCRDVGRGTRNPPGRLSMIYSAILTTPAEQSV